MRPSTLSQELNTGLCDFAWDEWAQMGVLADPRRRSPWAQDPEALVVFTLEVARDDPRLFDELLDWLVVNESLLNMRRLTAMCDGPEDEKLVLAMVVWLDAHRRSKGVPAPRDGDLEPLFRGLSTAISDPDPVFAAAGFLRSPIAPAGRAGTPDMHTPINFAFRLRQLLGLNARAEVMRFLLTDPAGSADATAITRSAGFARRNVRQALLSLQSAGVVSQRGRHHYAIDMEGWMRLLRIDAGELPSSREWPQLLGGLRKVARWLQRSDLDELSGYMLGSEVRDLLEEVRDDFEQAGLVVGGAPAAGAWDDLEAVIGRALALLGMRNHDGGWAALLDRAPADRGLQIYADARGNFRWQLRSANGELVAGSADAYMDAGEAARAGQAFVKGLPSLTFDVYQDAEGAYRWRARVASGETVATSAESFAVRANASRAIDLLQGSAAP